MFSVWALYLEMIHESEDAIGSRMFPRLESETMMNLNLIVPPSELGHNELECDVSAA